MSFPLAITQSGCDYFAAIQIAKAEPEQFQALYGEYGLRGHGVEHLPALIEGVICEWVELLRRVNDDLEHQA